MDIPFYAALLIEPIKYPAEISSAKHNFKIVLAVGLLHWPVSSVFMVGIGMPLKKDKPLNKSCGNCKICLTVCPAGAIKEKKKTLTIWHALKN